MVRKKRTGTTKSANYSHEFAQELLRIKPGEVQNLSTGDVRSLLHELNEQQMQLEIQNEELRRSQAELADARDRYADLYDFAPVGYVILNENGNILDANLTVATMLGVERRELIGKKIQNYMQQKARDEFNQHNREVVSAGKKRTCEIDMHSTGGTTLTVRMESIAFKADGHYCLRTALIDITEKKQIEDALRMLNETLEQQAHTDELTGLPNRSFFMTVYKQKFDHIKRHFRRLALFMLDLNNFKLINDELGHVEGDHVLRLVAGRLQNACRSRDFLARIGGDEFVLLVEDYRDTHDLIRIAEKIDACINVPIKLRRNAYRISTSIGIAILNDTDTSTALLLKAADDAMYMAKHSGRLYCMAGTPCMGKA